MTYSATTTSTTLFRFTHFTADLFANSFVDPLIVKMCALASLICTLILIIGGYHYITASGNPDSLLHAKKVIRNALIGLSVVLVAASLAAILSHTYSISASHNASQAPDLPIIAPTTSKDGLVGVLTKVITGLMLNIIQTIAEPFMKALNYFTSGTPLMTSNSSVFHLWLVTVGITDSLFIFVLGLIGFRIMSSATFGFSEISLRHLLPQVGFTFLLVNISIFLIDGIIELSNAMIHVLNLASPSMSVWTTLAAVTRQAGNLGVASLLIMLVFLVLSIMLLVYYVGRLVTLYVGALLAPIVCLLWLLPEFKDFVEVAIKAYLSVIFVLFIHVVILKLAASIFASLVMNAPNNVPNPVMSLIVGLATVMSLLKTQGFLMQLSYVGAGVRGARKVGAQVVNVMSYISGSEVRPMRQILGRTASIIPPDKHLGAMFRPNELSMPDLSLSKIGRDHATMARPEGSSYPMSDTRPASRNELAHPSSKANVGTQIESKPVALSRITRKSRK